MPNDAKSLHPSGKLEIVFTEEGHRYTDSFGAEYRSVTTLVHDAFEKFDAEKISLLKSARTGIPAEAYREEWDRAGKEASLAGTRMHENCERQMLGRFREMHTPRDEEERIEFRAAWQEVEKIRENRFPGVEPEKLVFSPRFFVAGSIDLLIRKAPKCYLLLDWKKVKELSYRSFDGKKGIHPATENLFDCNFIHYSLQLSIYEQILRLEHYIEPDARVEKFLNVYRKEGRFDHVQCLDLPYEALLLMAWNISNENLSPIPF